MLIAPMAWADPRDGQSRRVFQIDNTTCPDGGGRMRWVADVTEPTVIRKILPRVQTRAPPRSGPTGEGRPDADTHFTLAG